ncbi:hypothetical protein GQ54DRAFT_312389 [Martensiomyces pterosporus]|nr:hypothetical protein GQ54DRAFT_312389 [Martensiomyces pterosporus]
MHQQMVRRVCKRDHFTEGHASRDPARSLAHRVVNSLSHRDPKLMTSMHLTKLLEIELGSVPPSFAIPHDMHLWLGDFRKHRVDPCVQTFTVIINAYIRHGDAEYAMRVFEQMQLGSLALTLPDRSTISISVPQPNEVTVASIAGAWCSSGRWERVRDVLNYTETHGMPVSQRLVTRIVSEAVDRGEMAIAEQIWTKYGHAHGSLANEMKKQGGVNTRALAKLVLGYSRAGSVDKALQLFEIACRNELPSAGKAYAEVAHLAGLFNAVLRCSLDAIQPSSISSSLCLGEGAEQTRAGPSSRAMSVALRHGIRYDIATYNVLLARLSHVACGCIQSEAKADVADADRAALADATSAMHKLYLRLRSEGLVPDDTTLSHLIPMWVHLGHSDLVAASWQMCIQNRYQHKVKQVRRHIMHSAKRWGVEAETSRLLAVE